jgi:hypothetical protein
MSPLSFSQFTKKFGFKTYPFNVYTSEKEVEKGSELFVSTSMYGPILEAFNEKQTMLICGDRGTGKTAIIYDFERKTEEKNTLIVNVNDYDDLSTTFSSQKFYDFIIRRCTDELFRRMALDRKSGRKLSKTEKIQLSYYLARFGKTVTANSLKEQIDKIQVGFGIKFFKFLYKIIRTPVNVGANAFVLFLSDLVSRSIGVPTNNPTWSEYFPEISSTIDDDFKDAESSYASLKRLTDLIKKIGYSRVVVVLDKIDEDTRLNNAAEEISEFIKPVVTDNKFLLDNDFQVVISLWIIPFNMLREQVRTQKIYCPSVQWSNPDLIAALERRTKVFTDGPSRNFGSLFSSEIDETFRNELLFLCNRNPRDLWHLFDKIFRAQYRIDANSAYIQKDACMAGMDDFVKEFNFYEYYPKRSNSRANSMDIYAYIKHLLKLENPDFTRNQLNERAGTGSSTQNYVAAMESMGLVERTGTAGGSATFKIRDPKVSHALKHNIEISRSI